MKLEGEEAQRNAKRRIERERGRREATADMSEDLSEGEKGDAVTDMSAHGESTRARLPRIHSVDVMETLKGKKLYIVLVRHELNFVALVFKYNCRKDYTVICCNYYLLCLMSGIVYQLSFQIFISIVAIV